MSYSTLLDLRNSLVGNSSLTALVPSSDIQVGWKRELANFPCIIISQAAGTDNGYLGYSTSSSGNKVAKENVSYQIDIYSRNSIKEILDIEDVLRKILLNNGYRKTSDNDAYNSDYQAYRKITIWSSIAFHND